MTFPDGRSLRGIFQDETRYSHFHDGSYFRWSLEGPEYQNLNVMVDVNGDGSGRIRKGWSDMRGQCGKCDADTRRSRLKVR